MIVAHLFYDCVKDAYKILHVKTPQSTADQLFPTAGYEDERQFVAASGGTYPETMVVKGFLCTAADGNFQRFWCKWAYWVTGRYSFI